MLNDNAPNSKFKKIISEKLTELVKEKRSYKKRLLISASVCFAFCFTFLFYGPLEMVAFSANSLLYTYKDVVWMLLLLSFAVFAVTTPIFALLPGKFFNYFFTVLFSFTLSGYIQAAFLNGNLGALTGDPIDWMSYKSKMIWGLVIWSLVLLAVMTVLYFRRKLWRKCVIFISLVLVVIQLVPMIGIFTGAYDGISSAASSLDDFYLSRDEMFNFSKEKNVIVFVLDRLDYDFIEELKQDHPDFFDKLNGFTSYTNAISVYARTKPALSNLLNGYEGCAYDIPAEEYLTQGWYTEDKHLLKDLKSNSYRIDLYTEMVNLFNDGYFAEEYVDNLQNAKPPLKKKVLLEKLMNLSAYRYSPLALKPFYWSDTNYYNNGVFNESDVKTGEEPYYIDETLYLDDFKKISSDESYNCFKFYHFMGPHDPYYINADGTRSKKPTSRNEQLMGSFQIIYNTFERMKELGIYDDAAIIITADHGHAVNDSKALTKATRIGLYYKPSGASNEPLKESSAPVSVENIPATIIKAIGGDYSKYGTPIDDISPDAKIVRRYFKTAYGISGNEEHGFRYEITGDASNFDNWKLVEEFKIKHPFY